MGLRERVLEFIAFKGIDKATFERNCGLSNDAVKKMGDNTRNNTLDKISKAYPEINIAWLKTGIGNMLLNQEQQNNPTLVSDKVTQKPIYDVDYKLVPIIHIDSVGGMHSSNSITQEPQYIEGYAPFTDARDGDVCIIQSGNSMTPTCPSGSLLLLRQVEGWREYFGFGNIFVIELEDGRRLTKEVNRFDENPKEYVWCVSHNPSVHDEELPKSIIRSVWKVIKIQIDKGW